MKFWTHTLKNWDTHAESLTSLIWLIYVDEPEASFHILNSFSLSAVLYILPSKHRLAKIDMDNYIVLLESLSREQTTSSLIYQSNCNCMGGCLCYLTGKSIWQNTMVRDSPRLGKTYLGTHPTCWYANLISFSYSPLRNTPLLIFHRCFCKSRAHQKWSVLLNTHSSHLWEQIVSPGMREVSSWGSEQQEAVYIHFNVSRCTFLFLLARSMEHSASAFRHTHRI